MQKSNDLLGKKLKEAKKAYFSKALGITKNNQKKKKSIKLQQPHQ
ncbi:hypothetical protein [Helicobacter pullorum]|nr:hypothetical protein [Helicobacter pullorum]